MTSERRITSYSPSGDTALPTGQPVRAALAPAGEPVTTSLLRGGVSGKGCSHGLLDPIAERNRHVVPLVRGASPDPSRVTGSSTAMGASARATGRDTDPIDHIVATGWPAALITGGALVAQTIPATEVAADSIEVVHDLFDTAHADGHIDELEAARIKAGLDWAVHHADRANLDRALGVCLIRGGYGGDRHLRLVRQVEELHDLAPCDPDPLEAA